MDVGSKVYRYTVNLGTITTNHQGKGEACFDLHDYASQIPGPRVIGPRFMILTPGTPPLLEFDTSYEAFPSAPPPLPGRIIINLSASSNPDKQFSVDMSYGEPFGYPAGIAMYDGDQIGDEFDLIPGMHTVNEYFEPGWDLTSINIIDPTGGSYRSGRTAVINLAPGETVEITFVNVPRLPPPP
jgi:hypothetical protein